MKVMLPVLDKDGGREVLADGFWKAPYICIYNSNDKSFEWIATSVLNSAEGELGDEIRKMGVETVISGNMTPIALQIFLRSDISVFQAKGTSIHENIELLGKSELLLFTSQVAREIQSCSSGSCGSCSSTSCN